MSSISIDVDPDTFLVFRGDFCSATSVRIFIRNVSPDKSAIFKIKTTCPHRYVVKPHRGEIPASSNMEIDVTLLPFHFRETEKYNDKFLLQACASTKLNKEYSKHDFWSMVPKEELYERKLKCVFKYSITETIETIKGTIEDVPDSHNEALLQPIQQEDKKATDCTSNHLSPTNIFKEKNHDMTAEEEAEVQKKLSQAKAEIQNLIREGQRLRLANQQLQQDIDVHSRSKCSSNTDQTNGNIGTTMSSSVTTSVVKRSSQSKTKTRLEIIMQSKVAFVLICIAVMWLGIGMGKFIM